MRNERGVSCSHCGAGIGEHCLKKGGKKYLPVSHKQRFTDWRRVVTWTENAKKAKAKNARS